MNNPEQNNTLAKIRKTQETISVIIGTVFAITMCVDFFTYALLADRGLITALWLMGLSVIVMLLILFYLKHVSFFLTRLWLGRRAEFREIMARLDSTDL